MKTDSINSDLLYVSLTHKNLVSQDAIHLFKDMLVHIPQQ